MRSDTIVAARVPVEIKEQGNAILAKLGFTPTQLINSAYRYVLEFEELPCASTTPKPGRRTLDAKHMQQLMDELTSLTVCTYDYSRGGTRTFKDALSESLASDYEVGS